MTINFKSPQKSNRAEKSIFCLIGNWVQTIILLTDKRCNSKYCNKSEQIAMSSYAGCSETNERLATVKKRILKIYRKFLNDKSLVLFGEFRVVLLQHFKRKKARLFNFSNVFLSFFKDKANQPTNCKCEKVSK